ncbi:trypsin-like peptidase domain-containing protein, partial [candidate division KSB1 bacterium]|nr:trypsin-like peptidase domain-containing protein [candidate division KSB1 bacterium]NIS26906.1 trypsin-like peptidase domain-containing protein [candidate division KSB1 bacterium]NIT73739.1 trypsin-like peptidase domain-containing protein [candidate division KSB1 bacterium]NIU27637.1 trypsin-like peptidase domain-containing protein [candidate division KSB1 bacterium]NIU94273.1 hypothetical protein [candidate division KSB1 bacterium]
VLTNADLVLLKVADPIPGWIPLNSYDGNKPQYKEEISALGFNSGATGRTTRELRKGYGEPEILKNILPPKDRKELEAVKIPDISLPIYYLDGSLLPGFSGSPVVNRHGKLIGIGDGGLEKGASNVSWVIPAHHLDKLTASRMTSLPGDLSKASQSFSADMDVPTDYREVRYNEFVFVKTKTRTFEELLETTDDPEGLLWVLKIFEEFTVDYFPFEFDIYEDINYGLIITLPAGLDLIVDEEGTLMAAGDGYGDRGPYDILFHVGKVGETGIPVEPVEHFLNQLANAYLEELNSEDYDHYVEYQDFRTIEFYGNDKYVLRSAFNDFDNYQVDSHEINYITFLTNKDIYFLAAGTLDRFDDEFYQKFERSLNTDCRQQNLDPERDEVCFEVEEMLMILTSVHLTTFANPVQ